MGTMDVNVLKFDVYIKRRPELFDNSKAKDLLDKINRVKEENPDLEEDAMVKNIETFAAKMSRETGAVDYSGCDSFWITDASESLVGQQVTLLQQDSIGLIENFDNIEELNEKYMDLREFLDGAEYIGKYIRRTKNVDGDDRSLMEEDYSVLVLFATEDHMIIQDNFLFGKRFKMLSPRYFEDGNFEYYGDQNNEFNDKEEIYQAIVNQLSKENGLNM